MKIESEILIKVRDLLRRNESDGSDKMHCNDVLSDSCWS